MSAREGSSSSANTDNESRPICHHNCVCVLNTSTTGKNPGRKFYSCPYWKDKSVNCEFFVWVDKYEEELRKLGEKAELKAKLIEMEETNAKLEERWRIAEVKAERRKEAKKLLLEALITTREDHARMVAEFMVCVVGFSVCVALLWFRRV